MTDNDPSKPTPDGEKFKPQNVAEDGKQGANRSAGTKGRDLPRGSETETRSASQVRR